MQCNACFLQSDNHCSIWLLAWFAYLIAVNCNTRHPFSATTDVVGQCGQSSQTNLCMPLVTARALACVHVVCCVLTTKSSTFHHAITLLDRRIATICTDITVSVQTKLKLTMCAKSILTSKCNGRCAIDCHKLNSCQLAKNRTQTKHRDSIGTIMHY